MIAQNRRLMGILISVAILLLIPFTAMQFTNEVNWSAFDFMVMGALLLGTGIVVEIVLRKVRKASYRIAICAAIILAFLLVWAELAVGVFGTPFAGS